MFAVSMEILLKVASPPTAATVKVPPSLAPAELVPMASVMEFVAVVTSFPLASCTCTLTPGEIAVLTSALVGWTEKTSLLAGAAVMLKEDEVAEV